MKNHSHIFISLIILLVAGALGNYVYRYTDKKIAAGEPAQTAVTTPPATQTENSALQESRIRVAQPLPYATATSPLIISGEARGVWYFEASFPVEIIDGSGRQVAATIATAKTNWMTEDFVPFSATLSWATTTATSGVLRLHRDNPSGLPEHDAFIDIPIVLR